MSAHRIYRCHSMYKSMSIHGNHMYNNYYIKFKMMKKLFDELA